MDTKVGGKGFWMMAILLMMVIVILSALVVELACQSYRRNQENAELQARVPTLARELQSSRERLAQLKLQLDTLELMVADQKLLIEGKQGEVTLLEQQLAELKRDYVPQSDLTDKTKALREENDKLIKEVNRMYGDFDKLKSELKRRQQDEEARERSVNAHGDGRVQAADKPPAMSANGRKDRERCSYCRGTGTAQLYVKCKGCGGMRRRTGSLSPCPDCGGKGRVYKPGPCPRCAGMGRR